MVRRPVGDPALPVGSAGAPAGVGAQVGDRVLTVPNLLSGLRLLGVPAFLWLLFGPHLDLAAFGVLGGCGLTDYVDGKLARAWNQQSRLGQLLDPAADRLTVVATVVALAARGILPYWLLGLLLGRELAMAVPLAAVRRVGYRALPVSFAGKAATLNLLYGFPLLLLGTGAGGAPGRAAAAVGWAFVGWGTTLYWFAGLLYARQARQLLREA